MISKHCIDKQRLLWVKVTENVPINKKTTIGKNLRCCPCMHWDYLSLSTWLRRSWEVLTVPAVDLHALPDPGRSRSCANVLILWGKGGFSGLISQAAYSWNRTLRPPGLGLPCVGWCRAYLEMRSPWGGWSSFWCIYTCCCSSWVNDKTAIMPTKDTKVHDSGVVSSSQLKLYKISKKLSSELTEVLRSQKKVGTQWR